MLRGEESDKDEEYIVKLCDELRIKHYVKRINIEYVAKDSNVSLEVAGRNERYRSGIPGIRTADAVHHS